MTSISNRTVSKLFGIAAGRCSMCKTPLVERDVKIGQMAHIIAKNFGGARGNISVTGDINGYENLILLCPNHHAEIDDNENRYPPEELHRIKAEHENYVRLLFDQNSQKRVMDVSGLRALMLYLPFTQMVVLTHGLPERFNHMLLYITETLDHFSNDNPQCRPFSDVNLEEYFLRFSQCIFDLVDYEQHAFIGETNVFMPGSLIDADPNTSYLNPMLNNIERRKASQEIANLLNGLSNSYHPFLQYLRNNYPEVNLASFIGR
ncbi:hypothetical protein D3C72_151170 [compost metagenome]